MVLKSVPFGNTEGTLNRQLKGENKMAYRNEEKTPATGITGTVLGGTALAAATGLLNGGIGGLFGNQNPSASPIYQLSQKDTEIAQLKAQQYSDNKVFALTERVSAIESKVVSIETATPLRDKILSDSILNLQQQLSEISVRRVPNYALDPGYGPAFVAPMPPPVLPTVQSGTSTPATTAAAA